MANQLVIVNNESVFEDQRSYYCDNIAIRTVVEGLNKNFEILGIFRNSQIKRFHKIDVKKIKLSSNIFTFLFNIFKTFKQQNTSYLLISITPYTFLSFLLLFIFRKKIFLYLRSDGYEEYKVILGYLGPFIYHIMYTTVTMGSEIITCQRRLVKKKSNLVFPSELNFEWSSKVISPTLHKPRLLYVGRIKVEKGIFSLIKIFDEITLDVELSIVGKADNFQSLSKKIKYLGYVENSEKLRKIYDDHNIFILPSFTEAHPQVVDESLARLRPVILFNEINHVIENKEGIFVSKRNSESLSETIEFIMKNYSSIQAKMKRNKLPTKSLFIAQMTEILK